MSPVNWGSYPHETAKSQNNSYGDAINWISLLENVPNNEDLFFVSADRDYQSPANQNTMNIFLVKEWNTNKNSNLLYYTSLVQFLNEHVKDINLITEKSKETAIELLLQSGSFSQTHTIIRNLKSFQYFTDAQANQIINNVSNNNQVYGVIDDDVISFLKTIIAGREDKISKSDDNGFILKKIGISK